jgi:ParB family chromosome partitioning protein
MIIAGERRYRASLEAGLKEVPCIELDVDDRAVAEISLIENLQRKDLNPFEEADGLQALAQRFSYTHEEIAQRIGKSRTSITESLSLSNMPPEIRQLCRHADITAKSMLLQVVRQPSVDEMRHFVERVVERGLSREEARQINKDKNSKPKGYLYRYTSSKQSFSVVVKFRKAQVKREDVRAALEEAMSEV